MACPKIFSTASGLSVDHQFWVDCSDASWFGKGYSELSNPEVIRRDWNGAGCFLLGVKVPAKIGETQL